MLCIDCRKKEAQYPDTRWERMREWLFRRLFVKEIESLSNERFIQGFGDGYKQGFDQSANLRGSAENIKMGIKVEMEKQTKEICELKEMLGNDLMSKSKKKQ